MSNQPICIISTVGQSVFRNLDKQTESDVRDFAKQTLSLEALNNIATAKSNFAGEDLYHRALNTLNVNRDNKQWLRGASAELNSILRIIGDTPKNPNDQLHFLATETPDGVLAARIIADFCQDYFGRKAEVHVIEGLQVNDSQRFRRRGLPLLIQTIYRILNKAHRGTFRRIFNPTGGFKSVIPYFTIIGMLEENVEMQYIFERSEELIRLAQLPINLDFEELGEIKDVLQAVEEQDEVSEAELRQLLKFDESVDLSQQPLYTLFEREEIDGEYYYSLGALGVIANEHLKNAVTTEVWLSKQAKKAFDTIKDAEIKRGWEKILNEIGLAENRDKHMHRAGSSFPVYKLGRSKARAFYVYEKKGDYVLILELAYHINETDYNVTPTRRDDYGKFERWTGSKS